MKNTVNKQKGIATVESVLLLGIFVVFMTYSVGVFGVIHTGILNSISARAYTFETFRNRTNLVYFRDFVTADFTQTIKYGVRIHGIVSEKETQQRWTGTDRKLAQGRESEEIQARPSNPDQMDIAKGKERFAVNPVLIKTTYGICLDSKCGDN